MCEIHATTLGRSWLNAMRFTCTSGDLVANELVEVRGINVAFDRASADEPILSRFANRGHIEEMYKVFFSSQPNQFGHSYQSLMQGPSGRNDLVDVIELLQREPFSKRALLTLVASSTKVPCVNAIHFLCRGAALEATYFARGQDMYRKFYADALCIYAMASKVADGLQLSLARVRGFISSAHIYLEDIPSVTRILKESEQGGHPEDALSRACV